MFENYRIDQFKDLYGSVNTGLEKDLFDLITLKTLGSAGADVRDSFPQLSLQHHEKMCIAY